MTLITACFDMVGGGLPDPSAEKSTDLFGICTCVRRLELQQSEVFGYEQQTPEDSKFAPDITDTAP
jgi:hypothetical protein